MKRILLAAIARFPDRGRAIEELAGHDEEFRSICADYADVEAALVEWERGDSPLREERCTEYRALRQNLALEIERALDRAGSRRRPA